MRRALPVVFLVACGLEENVPITDTDHAEVAHLVDAVQPERAMELATAPARTLQLSKNCQDRVIDDNVVAWSGPCTLDDGAVLDGQLVVYSDDDGLLLSADRLTISQGSQLEVMLSGTIELARRDDLVQLDLSIQGCGALGPSCDTLVGGAFGLDLDYSLYPADTFPERYTAIVRGAVGRADSIVRVEGHWQVDAEVCAQEGIDGTLALGTIPRQTLQLDGASSCDGCLAWRVEGVDVPPLCELTAP